MILKAIFQEIQLKYLKVSSSDKKIKYLRKQGMKIGENCHFETMLFSTEPYLIEIGDNVAITEGTEFIPHDGGIWCFSKEMPEGDVFGKIIVGNNVYFGSKCIILLNTKIGNNCLIGAGSVLRGNYPDNSVIIGNPARVLTRMNIQGFFYKQNHGLLMTHNISDVEKKPIVIRHFDNIQSRNH